MLDLALMPLPAPAGPHPATIAVLVAAGAYVEALDVEGEPERAVLDAVTAARADLDTAAARWVEAGQPDGVAEGLPLLARAVVVAAAVVVAQDRDRSARGELVRHLRRWAQADYPGLPS